MSAAAMLSPMAELAVGDTVVFELGQRSMDLWPQWIAELQATHPADSVPIYFRRDGTLVVAHAPDQSELAHFTRRLQHKLPLSYRSQMKTLDGQALAACEPALADRFKQGLYLQGEGQLDNSQWMEALASTLDCLGVTWHEGLTVTGIDENHICSNAGAMAFDVTVDARGVGSKPLLSELRGVRGEVLRVECPAVQLCRPVRLMHPRYQLYVAPRPGHQFVVGATELESEDTGNVTLRSMLELGSALYSLHPAFGEARVLRLSAALRPALDNDQPICQQVEGVWHLNGLYRHGYLCAPALVETLTQEILKQTT